MYLAAGRARVTGRPRSVPAPAFFTAVRAPCANCSHVHHMRSGGRAHGGGGERGRAHPCE